MARSKALPPIKMEYHIVPVKDKTCIQSSAENSHTCTTQKSPFDSISSSHCHCDLTWFEAWWCWDLQQAFLEVGIVLLVDWIKLLDFELFQYISDELLAFDNFQDVLVGLFALFCEFPAVGHTICNFEQFLGDFAHCKVLAFFYLSTSNQTYFQARFFDKRAYYSNILMFYANFFSFYSISCSTFLKKFRFF